MTAALRLHPKTQPVDAWQYTGQTRDRWPVWVRGCCEIRNGLMIHIRRSGDQELRIDEWLVRDLDGEVAFYTTPEIAAAFEERV